MRAVERQRTAVAGLLELKGQCFYDYQLRPEGAYGNVPPPGPAWLRERLGIDHFANIDGVVLWDPQSVGPALRRLKELPTCRRLYLQFNETRLTDEELADLAMLRQLRELEIQSPRQTDRILSALEPLTNLESFTIAGRAEGISDDGVAHLAGLKSLWRLVLANQEHQAGITDRGLDRLRALTRLRELDLSGNKVTASGVSELQKSLPNCKIVW